MMTDARSLVSKTHLDDWRGDVTLYAAKNHTRPMAERVGLSWPELGETLAPAAGPQVVADKDRVRYVTPGRLREAPLIGKTLERAVARGEPTVGKQRSAAHVTSSTWVMVDLDGGAVDELKAYGQAIKAAGIAAAVYTSYSCGNPAKPGARVRVVLPVDHALDSMAYSRTWAGANAVFFGGKADPSGARLSQAQGTWATHPDWKVNAKRWSIPGGVASAAALQAAAPDSTTKPSTTRTTAARPSGVPLVVNMTQVAAALACFDPDDYTDWNEVVSMGVALAHGVSPQDAQALRDLVTRWSESASEAAKAGNDKPQYSVEARFDAWTPTTPPEVAVASIYAGAKTRAMRVVQKAATRGDWSGTGPYWKYLAAYHRRAFDDFMSTLT